jgi:sRNA-binding regulator protein Hfq
MPDTHSSTNQKHTHTEDGSAVVGQRKLIRPTLSATALAEFRHPHNGDPLTVHAGRPVAHTEDSHAEMFYLQKQLQTQTRLVVVLADGEQIEGTLEWYDHCSIKLRSSQRRHVLIYKSGIKYLFKADERTQPAVPR